MLQLIVLVLFWSATSAISIALTGDRKLLSADLASPLGALGLLQHWRFVLAMTLAVFTRLLFVYINGAIVRIPHLANSATTVTALITAVSYPVILSTNALMLHERLAPRQYVGTAFILVGIVLACSKN